jgi:hypothetical protein
MKIYEIKIPCYKCRYIQSISSASTRRDTKIIYAQPGHSSLPLKKKKMSHNVSHKVKKKKKMKNVFVTQGTYLWWHDRTALGGRLLL